MPSLRLGCDDAQTYQSKEKAKLKNLYKQVAHPN